MNNQMEIINVSSYIEKYNYTIQKISSIDSYNPAISTMFPISQNITSITEYYNPAISTMYPVSQHEQTFTNSYNYLLN